jgi:hypothetical protein
LLSPSLSFFLFHFLFLSLFTLPPTAKVVTRGPDVIRHC